MPLRKRFLHPDPEMFRLSRRQLVIGVVAGLFFAFILYTLIWGFRTMLPFISSVDMYGDYLLLSQDETRFYNIFCAFISVIFGQSLTFTYWFNRPRRRYGRLGRRLDGFINDIWPLNIILIWILTQFFVVEGILFFWDTKYYFNLYPDYNIYFILMIIVLFMQQWLTVARTFKRKGIKWMLISAVVVSALSLGMSKITFSPYDTFAEQFDSRSVYHKYHMDWPTVDSTFRFDWQPRGYNQDGMIYVAEAKDRPADGTPVIVMRDMGFYSDTTLNGQPFMEVSTDSVDIVLKRWQAQKKTDPYYGSHIQKSVYYLKINRDIPMAFVNKLRSDMSEAGIGMARYAVQPAEYEAGYTFRAYDDWVMFNLILPEYLSYPADRRKAFYREKPQYQNVVELKHAGEAMYRVNSRSVAKNELKEELKRAIAVNTDYIVRYHISDASAFQDYIDVIVGIRGALDELRAEHYGYNYKTNRRDYDASHTSLPMRILEIIETEE